MQFDVLHVSLLVHINAVCNTTHPIEICSRGMQDTPGWSVFCRFWGCLLFPLLQIIGRFGISRCIDVAMYSICPGM